MIRFIPAILIAMCVWFTASNAHAHPLDLELNEHATSDVVFDHVSTQTIDPLPMGGPEPPPPGPGFGGRD